MIIDLIRAEFIKLRKNYLLLYIVTFDLVSILIGSGIYISNKFLFEGDGTQSLVLWGQTSLYSSQLFFPILIGIFGAISWQIEEKNKNWQRITNLPVKYFNIIISKFISIQLLTAVNQLVFTTLFIITSLLLNISEIKITSLLLWSFTAWLGTFPISAIQLFVSVKFKDFTFPILISAIGSIMGLITLFIGNFIFSLFPYTQITVGMRSRALTNFNQNELLLFMCVILIYSIIFIFFTTQILKHREV